MLFVLSHDQLRAAAEVVLSKSELSKSDNELAQLMSQPSNYLVIYQFKVFFRTMVSRAINLHNFGTQCYLLYHDKLRGSGGVNLGFGPWSAEPKNCTLVVCTRPYNYANGECKQLKVKHVYIMKKN